MEGYSGNYSLHDGGQAVGEVMFDGNGTPTLYAFDGFGASGLEWRSFPALSSGGYSAYTFDPQGSVVQPVTLYPSTSGGPPSLRVRTSSAYDGFGLGVTAPADGSGMANPVDPIGFGGQFGYYHDYTTGLYLLTHRYYDAGAGRFVSRDPIGYKGGINLYGFAGNNPVNRMDPNGFAPEEGKPGSNPFISEELQEDYEIAEEYGEMWKEREAGARRGSTGRALALRSALNPRGSNAEIAGLVRQLSKALMQRMRSSAGFSQSGKAYLIDQNVTVSLSRSDAAKLMQDLRGAGYNARSVQEIFGSDPGDAALRTFNEQVGAEPITKDRGQDLGGGFAGQVNKNISSGLRRIPSNDRQRIFNFLKGHLTK